MYTCVYNVFVQVFIERWMNTCVYILSYVHLPNDLRFFTEEGKEEGHTVNNRAYFKKDIPKKKSNLLIVYAVVS